MKCVRQPRLSAALRGWVVVSLLVWIAALAFCAWEPLIESFHVADHHHGDEAAPPHEDTGHSHGPENGGGDDHSCCSTFKAIPQSAGSSALFRPDFGQVAHLQFMLLTQAFAVVRPDINPPRQPPDREWVFRPEVCLGPAFRSHAPPLAV